MFMRIQCLWIKQDWEGSRFCAFWYFRAFPTFPKWWELYHCYWSLIELEACFVFLIYLLLDQSKIMAILLLNWKWKLCMRYKTWHFHSWSGNAGNGDLQLKLSQPQSWKVAGNLSREGDTCNVEPYKAYILPATLHCTSILIQLSTLREQSLKTSLYFSAVS